MRPPVRAFTLIELLVVITIIVVLLALVTPALDKAIYQAELAVCAAHLRGIGSGCQTYSANFKRRYPHRQDVHKGNDDWRPQTLYEANLNEVDNRLVIRDYVPIDMLNDPLTEYVDLSVDATDEDSFIQGNISLWAGWGYKDEKPMLKLGDALNWGGLRFNALASDMDSVSIGGEGDWAQNAHPNKEGTLSPWLLDDEPGVIKVAGMGVGPKFVFSMWQRADDFERGTVDRNIVFDDGGVERFVDTVLDDDRMKRLALRYQSAEDRYEYLPTHR